MTAVAKIERSHAEGCKTDQWNYSCSCGLIAHLLETGVFVRYDASMCTVERPRKGPAFTPISEVLDEYLAGLRERCAGVQSIQEDDDE